MSRLAYQLTVLAMTRWYEHAKTCNFFLLPRQHIFGYENSPFHRNLLQLIQNSKEETHSQKVLNVRCYTKSSCFSSVIGGVDCILHGRRKRNPVERLIHGARLLDVTLRLALSFSHKNTAYKYRALFSWRRNTGRHSSINALPASQRNTPLRSV